MTAQNNADDLVIRGIRLAPEYAGFVRDWVTDDEAEHPGMGVTISYRGGARGEATVFVYDHGMSDIADGPSSPSVRAEFDRAMNEIGLHAGMEGSRVGLLGQYMVAESAEQGGFLCAEFMMQDRAGQWRSFLYLTGANGTFVKIRTTLRTDDAADYGAYEFATALASHNWPSVERSPPQPVTQVGAHSYEVFGLARIALFEPWRWRRQMSDYSHATAKGVVFSCYAPDNPQEAAYLMVTDGTDDPDEPDIASLTPEEAAAFVGRLEGDARRQMESDGRRLLTWGPFGLDESEREIKQLIVAYVAEEGGRVRHYLDVRCSAKGRKLLVGGCFDTARGSEFGRPIFDAIANAIILDGMIPLGKWRSASAN